MSSHAPDTSSGDGGDLRDAEAAAKTPPPLRTTLVHPLTEGLRVWSPDSRRTAVQLSILAAGCLLICASGPSALGFLACMIAGVAVPMACRGPSRIVTDHSGIAVSVGCGSRYVLWTHIESIAPHGLCEGDVLLRVRGQKDLQLRLSGFAPKDRAALLELFVKRSELLPAPSRRGLFVRSAPGLAPASGSLAPLGGLWQLLTQRAQAALSEAHDLASAQGTPVTPEHLALGLLHDGSSPAARLVGRSGVSVPGIQMALARGIELLRLPPAPGMDPRLRRVLHDARSEAEQDQRRFIGPEHLLIAIVQDPRGMAADVFRRAGFDVDTARLQSELASCGGLYAVETLSGT